MWFEEWFCIDLFTNRCILFFNIFTNVLRIFRRKILLYTKISIYLLYLIRFFLNLFSQARQSISLSSMPLSDRYKTLLRSARFLFELIKFRIIQNRDLLRYLFLFRIHFLKRLHQLILPKTCRMSLGELFRHRFLLSLFPRDIFIEVLEVYHSLIRRNLIRSWLCSDQMSCFVNTYYCWCTI